MCLEEPSGYDFTVLLRTSVDLDFFSHTSLLDMIFIFFIGTTTFLDWLIFLKNLKFVAWLVAFGVGTLGYVTNITIFCP